MHVTESPDIPSDGELWANDQSIATADKQRFEEGGRAIAGSPRPSDRSQGVPHSFNMEIYEKIYYRSPLVFQAVNKTADHVMQAGFRIQGSSKKNVEAINEWIDYIGFHTFLHEIVRNLMIWGNAYVEIIMDKDLKKSDKSAKLGWGIAELKPLNPSTMKVYRYETGEVIGYIQRPKSRRWKWDSAKLSRRKNPRYLPKNPKDKSGQKQKHWKTEVKRKYPGAVVFDSDQILHLKWNQLPSAEYGISPIEPVKEELITYTGVMGDVSAIIKRYGSPKIIWRIGTPERPPSKRMVDEFHDKVAGLSVADDISVSGVVDWGILDAGLKVMDMEPFINFLRKDVFAGLGVPELIMGGNASSGQEASEMALEAFNRMIMELQRFIETTCRRAFFPRVLGLGTWPFSKPQWKSIPSMRYMPPDTVEKSYLREISLFTAGLRSIEEVRNDLGYSPPLPEGKTGVDLQMDLAKIGGQMMNAERPDARGPQQSTGKTGSDDKKKSQKPASKKAKTKEGEEEETAEE